MSLGFGLQIFGLNHAVERARRDSNGTFGLLLILYLVGARGYLNSEQGALGSR